MKKVNKWKEKEKKDWGSSILNVCILILERQWNRRKKGSQIYDVICLNFDAGFGCDVSMLLFAIHVEKVNKEPRKERSFTNA